MNAKGIPEGVPGVDEARAALEILQYPTLAALTSRLAEMNTVELQQFALRAEQDLPWGSWESLLLKLQGGNINLRREHHQGGGTPVVDHSLKRRRR